MKILIRDHVSTLGVSTTIASNAVRGAIVDLMTTRQLDRFFRAKRVWWDSSKVVNREILTGLVFEE